VTLRRAAVPSPPTINFPASRAKKRFGHTWDHGFGGPGEDGPPVSTKEASRIVPRAMGYTHYWYRPPIVPEDLFRRIRSDFERLILPLSDLGVELAGGLGEGLPVINDDMIWFNGLRGCGHPPNEDLVIPYPSQAAQGIGPSATAIDGDFYNLGVTVRHRCCNGRCDCETFLLERSKTLHPHSRPIERGLFCEGVKTAFRPYDVAVTAALLIAKRHLHEQLVVHSNGRDAQWADARELCQRILGYGDWFGITEEIIREEPDNREVKLRILTEIAPPRG
jgi:hypothetical protein